MTTTTLSVAEELSALEAATANTDTTPRDLRGKLEVGKCARQGDVYVHQVDVNHERGSETLDRQVAVGNTQGSRHIAEGAKIKLFWGTARPSGVDSRAPLGPVVVSEEDWTLAHPEHPDMTFSAGTYQITHQLDAITGQRVED